MVAPGINFATLLQMAGYAKACVSVGVCVLLSDFIISFYFMSGSVVPLIKSRLPLICKQSSFMDFFSPFHISKMVQMVSRALTLSSGNLIKLLYSYYFVN